MGSASSSRSSTFRLLIWGPWRKRVAVAIGIIGLYDLVLAQFLPATIRPLFPTIKDVFPRLNWPWWVWIMILLTTIIIFMFESGHREINRLIDEISPEKIAAKIELQAIEYDQPQDNRHVAAVRITNRNKRRINVYGKTLSIFRNDDGFTENLHERINFYQSKLTWRGGDSSKGWKTIDPDDHRDLNIAFVESHKLRFLFRKESPYIAAPGIYRVNLVIMGKLGDQEIQDIVFVGQLDYWGKVKLSFREWKDGEAQPSEEVDQDD